MKGSVAFPTPVRPGTAPVEQKRPMRRSLVPALLVWAALNVPALLLSSGFPDGLNTWWQILIGAVVTGVAVALHRDLPLVSFVLCLALWWTLGTLDNDLGSAVLSPYLPAVFVISFTLGRLPVPATAVLPAVGGTIVVGSVLAVVVHLSLPVWFLLLTVLIFACLLPWLTGRYWQQRHELQLAGWEHAHQMELQQRILIDQARLRERTRIAEDMHDSLGHELSLIALRAGALQVAPGVAESFRSGAGELRESTARAMEHLREIIGVLREDDSDSPLDPSQSGIGALVDRTRASGVRVDLEQVGEPEQLPAMTDKALYRVVQESLTNAIKHAPGAPVTVRVEYGRGGVMVTVRNAAPQEPPADDRPSGGRGLIGLRERARLAGGRVHAAPLPDGGFQVTARLPRVPEAIRPDEDPSWPPAETGATEDGLADATTHVRRRFITAVALPCALFVLLVVGMIGYYAYLSASSTLSEEDFDGLRVGQPTADVNQVLPDNDMNDPPSEELPVPPGASCSYYRSSDALFVRVDVYRLCFAQGHLVAKDVITAESRAPVDNG
ncbi:sensor histidine kinase [Streptomyces sp. KPB2]|uniref:sensor histidine kinase n=1 Tax=Streptomyces TaxID=1883 RepID=UPI000F70875F|nr:MULTISPECIES: sensor histidine kinase [Streptomyces]AZM74754.1 sensor histidine kinase [Streptomyces sp. KPB2]MDU0257079.1 sensor histidine kinase [Streptomyces sp. PU10]QKW60266.1 sensor histidine kinase [Streptomyces sp. NA03103]